MADNRIDIGRAAVAAALARAGKRASTAAAVAAIVPLAMLTTAPQAAAAPVGCGSVCAFGSVTPNGDDFNYTYTISTSFGEAQVTRIELPEIQTGEFLSGSGSFLGSLPAGWSAGEQTTTAFISGAT